MNKIPLLFLGALLISFFTSGCITTVPENVTGAVEKITFNAPEIMKEGKVGTPYFYSFCKPDLKSTSDMCGGIKDTTNPTGGHPPYTFTLSSGGFPPLGLSLNMNGILSGTPTAAGTRIFTVCATDLDGNEECQLTTLTIKESGFTGVWEGTVILVEHGPEGSFYAGCSVEEEYNLNLTQNENRLTGTMTATATKVISCEPGMSAMIGIKEIKPITGTITGNTAEFTFDSTGTLSATDYTATLEGDTLNVKIKTCVSPDPRCTCKSPDPRCPAEDMGLGGPLQPVAIYTTNWFDGEFTATRAK
ncbi:MAG: Ig domain-containing protein [Candidatus Micrarchaeota archaeon]